MHDCTILSLLVAVPPVTEKLTTTSKGREALGGTVFIIVRKRIIPTSASFTTSPGSGCRNINSIAATINHGCVDTENG